MGRDSPAVGKVSGTTNFRNQLATSPAPSRKESSPQSHLKLADLDFPPLPSSSLPPPIPISFNSLGDTPLMEGVTVKDGSDMETDGGERQPHFHINDNLAFEEIETNGENLFEVPSIGLADVEGINSHAKTKIGVINTGDKVSLHGDEVGAKGGDTNLQNGTRAWTKDVHNISHANQGPLTLSIVDVVHMQIIYQMIFILSIVDVIHMQINFKMAPILGIMAVQWVETLALMVVVSTCHISAGQWPMFFGRGSQQDAREYWIAPDFPNAAMYGMMMIVLFLLTRKIMSLQVV